MSFKVQARNSEGEAGVVASTLLDALVAVRRYRGEGYTDLSVVDLDRGLPLDLDTFDLDRL